MKMRKEYKISFLVGFSIFAIYQALWWTLRIYGWGWSQDLNIPGLFLSVLAYPWSTIAFSFHREAFELLGQTGRTIITCAALSIGLGINFMLVTFVAIKTKKIIQRVSA